MKYTYPAIFTQENEGIRVRFPHFESYYTSGETVVEAIVPAENEFVSYIECDTLECRKFYESKAAKKALTIPSWLNAMAEREGVNFSAVLQNALKE